ncbi:hypothetical protein [Alteriqipengyuania sp. 357]
MVTAFPIGSRRALATILPPLAVFAALALSASGWAASHPGIGAALLCWIVADALALGAIARHETKRPGARALLGAFALAALVLLVGSRGPVREALFALPAVPLALVLTIIGYLGWSGRKALEAWRATGSLDRALAHVFPAPIVSLALAEARVLHIALLSWGRPADIPAGTTGFAYHRYLTPMLGVLLVLQLIELGVVHMLVMLWSPKLAWVLLAISAWGILWMLALLKSLRLNPVLLTHEGVRVRGGFLIDVLVPFAQIAEVRGPSGPEEVKAKTTLNAALLSWPEIMIDLREPMVVPGVLGRHRTIAKVAFKLDDAAAFHERLGRMR